LGIKENYMWEYVPIIVNTLEHNGKLTRGK